MTGITGHLVIRNGNKYDYPWKEAIKSILPVVDEMIVLEAGSEDDTLDDLRHLAKENAQIEIIHGDWGPLDQSEQVRPFLALSRLTNECINRVRTPWHFQIQGDEALHEEDLERLAELPNTIPDHIQAVSIPYTHFVANYSTTFPFMYQRIVRMARTGSGWHSTGDACHLIGTGAVYNSDIMMYHYGKVHPSNKAMLKEKDFQNMFTDLGFPDPKLAEMGEDVDYYYLFEDAYNKGLFKPFEGTHPKVMHERIAKAKEDGWEQFK